MTRAPKLFAISCEPSVLPLSAINTSPLTPRLSIEAKAFRIHTANVSDSFRHGIKTVSSQSPAFSRASVADGSLATRTPSPERKAFAAASSAGFNNSVSAVTEFGSLEKRLDEVITVLWRAGANSNLASRVERLAEDD